MKQTRIFPVGEIPLSVNQPVVIETQSDKWVRRDIAGACFSGPQETYQFLASQSPNQHLSDFVEITALLNDWNYAQPIRDVRKALYGNNRFAATTTLPVAKGLRSFQPSTLEAVAYGGEDSRAVSPTWLYDMRQLVLAPLVVQQVGEEVLISVSGVVSWDQSGEVLFPEIPEKQVGQIVDYCSKMMKEQGCSLGDLVRVRTFTSKPEVGPLVSDQLANRIGREFPSHHVLTTLDPADLEPLACEIQFLAVKSRDRDWSRIGTQVRLGGLRHLYLAPIQCERDSREVSLEMEAKEISEKISSACSQAELSWENIVSLFCEVSDDNAGAVLTKALTSGSKNSFRAGITASVNGRLLERMNRRIILTGTAIGT